MMPQEGVVLEHREPLADLGLEQHTGPVAGLAVADLLVRVPGGGNPDALEVAVACGHVGLQHLAHVVAEGDVGEPDDAGCGLRRSVLVAGAFGVLLGGELGLTDRLQRFGTVLAVLGMALDVDAGRHVVAGVHVGRVLSDLVAVAGVVPQVVVRVEDGQLGQQDLFGWLPAQPLLVRGQDVAERTRDYLAEVLEHGTGHQSSSVSSTRRRGKKARPSMIRRAVRLKPRSSKAT